MQFQKESNENGKKIPRNIIILRLMMYNKFTSVIEDVKKQRNVMKNLGNIQFFLVKSRCQVILSRQVRRCPDNMVGLRIHNIRDNKTILGKTAKI